MSLGPLASRPGGGSAWRALLTAPVALLLLVAPASLLFTTQGAEPGYSTASGTSGTSIAASTSGDWPTYLQNPTRTAANLAEHTLSVGNAKQLQLLWSNVTKGPIAASTTVVGDTAYVGSWDGNEYAFNATEGTLQWKTFLGTATGCGQTQGVTATATVRDSTLYVSGGNSSFYALDAATGHILWNVTVGNTSQGFFNYASPLIYNGSAYVGLASFCDKPLIPGALLKIDLQTGMIVNRLNTTPSGHLGGSIWSTPSVNASTNTIYVTTGNPGKNATGELSESILAVNATTMNLLSRWEVPTTVQIGDGDFGSTPTLFHDRTGRPMVGALNKNGVFYALNASNVSRGVVWSHKITKGQAVSSAAFGQGLVFAGAGTVTYKTVTSSGAAWALNPTTGRVVWEQPLTGKVLAAPAYANGLLVIGGGHTLFVLNAATGAKLWHFNCAAPFFAAPSIAHGIIFAGCADGHEYAFALPGTDPAVGTRSPAPPPPAATVTSVIRAAAPRHPVGDRTHATRVPGPLRSPAVPAGCAFRP